MEPLEPTWIRHWVGEHPRAFNVTINDLVVTACAV